MKFISKRLVASLSAAAVVDQSKASVSECVHKIGIAITPFAVLMFAAGYLQAQTWIQLAPAGPLPGARTANNGTVLDTTSNRMIVFGGFLPGGGTATYNDTWVLTNANGLGGSPQWINLIPQGAAGSPAIRYSHSSVYDLANNRMTIFGGFEGGCAPAVNDVWVLSNANGLIGTATWTQIFPVGTPPAPRAYHTAVYDPSTNRMIVFGGASNCPGALYSDVWVLTNANALGGPPEWVQLLPVGGPPQGQAAHSAVYDPINNLMTVFGGSDPSGSPTNAVWVLSNANGLGGTPVWTNLIPEGALGSPSPRAVHSSVYDPSSNEMTVYGSRTSPTEVWVLSNANGLGNLPSWTQLTPAGGPVGGKSDHGGVLDVNQNHMIVFGGYDGGNDTWVLDLINYVAQVQQPINADGSSVFNAKRGVVPVKFTLNLNGMATCQLPPATISLVRTAGGTIGPIDESIYLQAADNGSNFRISGCQYLYNLSTSSLDSGAYRVDITINGAVAGSGVFALK